MKDYDMDKLKALAAEIGYDIIAIEGEDGFCVLNGEDGMSFSNDQTGINDAMDILQQDVETIKTQRP